MLGYAPGDTPLNFVSLQGRSLVLKASDPSFDGTRFVVALFGSDSESTEAAKVALRSTMTVSDVRERFRPGSAFGLDLGKGSGHLYAAGVEGCSTDVALLPAIVFATGPRGTQYTAALEGVLVAVESRIVLPAPAERVPRADTTEAVPPAPASAPVPPPPEAPVPEAPRRVRPARTKAPAAAIAATASPGPPPSPEPAPTPSPPAVTDPEAGEPGKRALLHDHEVASWPTLRQTTMRVRVKEMGAGRYFVDLRRWYDDNGVSKPSNKGVNVAYSEIGRIREALDDIERIVTARGGPRAGGTSGTREP